MFNTAIAIVSAVLGAGAPMTSPPAAKPLAPAANGLVHASGISFRLPQRFRYSVFSVEGGNTYAAESPDGRSAVLVRPVLLESHGSCEASVDGVTVAPFETAGGLRACRITGGSEEAGAAVSLSLVSAGNITVSVQAIATSPAKADMLGRAVADSVRPGAGPARLPQVSVPRADPRMVGCFQDDRTVSFGDTSGGTSNVRCFEESLRFTEASQAWFNTRNAPDDPIGSGISEEVRRGVWYLDGSRLDLQYDDGRESQWDLYFADDGNVLANNRLWVRTRRE